jgi:hypothetical protein
MSAAMARRWHAGPPAHSWAWKRPGVGLGLCCWFGVEPPAGIEPATPSLPSMVGPLGAQDGPLRYLTTPLVTKTIGDGVVGYREAVRGTAAGKSLARMQIIVALSGASLTNCPDLPITRRMLGVDLDGSREI